MIRWIDGKIRGVAGDGDCSVMIKADAEKKTFLIKGRALPDAIEMDLTEVIDVIFQSFVEVSKNA